MGHELEQEYELTQYLNSTKEYVLYVLRTMPELRSINKRYELWQRVCQLSKGRVNYETVSRLARKIQNGMGLFLPEQDDQREQLAIIHRKYWKEE